MVMFTQEYCERPGESTSSMPQNPPPRYMSMRVALEWFTTILALGPGPLSITDTSLSRILSEILICIPGYHHIVFRFSWSLLRTTSLLPFMNIVSKGADLVITKSLSTMFLDDKILTLDVGCRIHVYPFPSISIPIWPTMLTVTVSTILELKNILVHPLAKAVATSG